MVIQIDRLLQPGAEPATDRGPAPALTIVTDQPIALGGGHIYISRRLRVFENDALVGPVLAGQLAVSTAEELLRAEPEARPGFVERAIAEDWGQAEARRAVLERNVPNADGTLERRLKKLRQEVLTVDPEHLTPSTRAEAKRLRDALRPLAGR